MTMPDERSRALLWVGGFLIALARDDRPPRDVRQCAVVIARRFSPSGGGATCKIPRPSGIGVELSLPQEIPSRAEDCRQVPCAAPLAWDGRGQARGEQRSIDPPSLRPRCDQWCKTVGGAQMRTWIGTLSAQWK